MKWNGDPKQIIALLGSIMIAIMAQIIAKSPIYILIIIILSIIIAFLILKMLSLLKVIEKLKKNKSLQDIVGIERIIPKKKESLQEEPTFLLEANSCIRILGSTLKTIWTDNDIFLKYLAQVGRRNVMIQILLLNPDAKSKYLQEKAKDENIGVNTFKNWIENSVSEFKRFKKNNEIERIELYHYDEFPVWNMIIIDHKLAKISYYPYGKQGGEVPYYVLNNQGEYNLLEPFIIYFEQLKKRSKKVEI
jgi:hypothetical protein